MSQDKAWNMKLVSQNTLEGFGGVGEGMGIQIAKDGRRIMWLAHEGAPKNFTGLDISDIKNPQVIVQTELPHDHVRSNSLEVTGDIMAVAYQTATHGETPAGVELFDIADPENPKSISFFDCSGPHSMGVHQLWFADGEFIHFAGGAPDFEPNNPKDSQFYRCLDVRNPSKPEEVGRWWYPGTRKGDAEAPPSRHPTFDSGFRAHNTNVYPERPDRCYLAYLDGGMFILDISDKSKPKAISSWNPHPPYPGFTHTALPLFDRDPLIVTDECVRNNGEDWPKLTWVIDMRDETNLVPISTLPLPPVEEMSQRPGRFGSHNIHENRPDGLVSSDTIFATYQNAGIRVFDIRNAYRPEEIAAFVPPAPNRLVDHRPNRPKVIQSCDIWVSAEGLIYCNDYNGGLFILEYQG